MVDRSEVQKQVQLQLQGINDELAKFKKEIDDDQQPAETVITKGWFTKLVDYIMPVLTMLSKISDQLNEVNKNTTLKLEILEAASKDHEKNKDQQDTKFKALELEMRNMNDEFYTIKKKLDKIDPSSERKGDKRI